MGLLDLLGARRAPRFEDAVFLALDLETTGLDPRLDSILSIGTVPIRGGTIRWGERWYQKVRPPSRVDAATEAVTIHGLLPDELKGEPRLEQVLPEVDRRLEGATLLVHYGALDVTALKRAFKAGGRPWPRPPVVDTLDLLGRLDRRRRLVEPAPSPTPTQLGKARAFLGLPPHEEHHALYDALATAELLLALRARLGLKRLG